MRTLCWNGVNDLRVETVPDPQIVNPADALLRVSLSTPRGSHPHFIDGYIPTLGEGDVIGHEFTGEVVEVSREVKMNILGLRPSIDLNHYAVQHGVAGQ
jgi:threonine dehydrogenase-like Zn-dependent dehydrogenase